MEDSKLSIYILSLCLSDQTCVELNVELNLVQKLVIYMTMSVTFLGMLLKLARFLSRDNVWNDRFEGDYFIVFIVFIVFILFHGVNMAACHGVADLNKEVHVLIWVMMFVCSIAMLLLAMLISNDNRRIQNQNPNFWRRSG